MCTLTIPQGLTQNKMENPIVYPVGIVRQNWFSVQPEPFLNHEATMWNLELYVKTELFHTIVFILNPAVVASSKDPLSLYQVVCNKLNIPPTKHLSFWQSYTKYVE